MILPDCVKNAIVKLPTDNNYIYGAESYYGRLLEIKEEKVSYIPQDMSTLANTLELYYKGMLVASGLKVEESLIKDSHFLPALYEEITTRIMPLIPNLTKGDSRELREFLKTLSEYYISTRYEYAQPTFDDFTNCMDFLTKQREVVMSALDPTRKWDKHKEEEKLEFDGIFR